MATRGTDKPPRNLLVEGSADPFRTIVAEAADGIVGVDEQQHIVIFNRAAETMFGYSAAQAIGKHLSMLLPRDMRSAHSGHVDKFRHGGQPARYMGQRADSLKAMRADGSEFAAAISILQIPADDGPLMVAHVRDISEKVELLERQVHLATRDPLTGALNRRAFLERAEAIDARRGEDGREYALLMLDLDHFKAVNDSYGHAVGDVVLQGFSQLCAATLRAGDIFARWGGEEFIALLPATSPMAAMAVAERIRLAAEKHVFSLPEVKRLRQTVSIGVAAVGRDPGRFDDVIRLADKALYAAKHSGRNRVSVEAGATNQQQHARSA